MYIMDHLMIGPCRTYCHTREIRFIDCSLSFSYVLHVNSPVDTVQRIFSINLFDNICPFWSSNSTLGPSTSPCTYTPESFAFTFVEFIDTYLFYTRQFYSLVKRILSIVSCIQPIYAWRKYVQNIAKANMRPM